MLSCEYNRNEKCTSWVAADIMCCSEHTGRRRLRDLRLKKGLRPKEYVSVGEFCEYYRIEI